MQADVGVGQGSALSPVLSALYISPIMKLFELKARRQGLDTTLLSYVDDGTVVAQSKHLDDNCRTLKRAYGILFKLFTDLGLFLEHDKSELFHFDRSRSQANPAIDLGFAPYTGATPLRPKTYWRYLGFYFDRKLTFREHVRFYSTKSFTTVQAMRMLGNSTRGLPPDQKRILYRACVLPIATYRYRPWYFEGARNKGLVTLLNQMQQKAALWITDVRSGLWTQDGVGSSSNGTELTAAGARPRGCFPQRNLRSLTVRPLSVVLRAAANRQV